jgi:hypothetical protein
MNFPLLGISLVLNFALAGCIWAVIARNRKRYRVERLKRRVAE